MFSWRIRTGTGDGERELRGDEKKLYVRVRRALWDYEPLRASHAELAIGIEGDAVLLRGRVRTQPQKAVAELLARRVEGVGSLTNELVSDADVVRSVADALAQDPRTAPYVLQVDARHGIVFLKGEAPDEATREAALEVASRVAVVAAVRDAGLAIGGPRYEPAALRPARPALPAAVGGAMAPGAR